MFSNLKELVIRKKFNLFIEGRAIDKWKVVWNKTHHHQESNYILGIPLRHSTFLNE